MLSGFQQLSTPCRFAKKEPAFFSTFSYFEFAATAESTEMSFGFSGSGALTPRHAFSAYRKD